MRGLNLGRFDNDIGLHKEIDIFKERIRSP